MTTFTVSYDLINNKNYKLLIDELNRLGAHRSLESFWLVAYNSTAKGLHDHLRKFMDSDDKLWVSELTRSFYYSQVNSGTNAWIDKNPPAR
ncbi:hypothetical protein [Pseudomonas sp. zfem002]|uniref:hypothetical protein n=1 Tax=Pseudomonas sp. zfem002 TaxID=3078197 RepID=UPI0029288591|nr:hypothetical protein [Pseudomonas sp. zfem002]MDU9393138.1 hypothetical protein [Pseudomonas sp. zfem002]